MIRENGKNNSIEFPTVHAIIFGVLLISGCSSSNDSQSLGDELAVDDTVPTTTEPSPAAPTNGTSTEQTTPQADSFDQPTQNQVFTLDESNALDIFRETVAVINEEQIGEFFDIFSTELELPSRSFNISNTSDDIVFSETFVAEPAYQLEEVFGSGEVTAVTIGDSYTCAGGGSIQIFLGEPPSSDASFVDCVVSEATYSGVTGRRNTFRGSIANVPYINFTRLASNGEMVTLSGNAFGGNTSFVSIDQLDGWSDLDFRQSNAGQDFRLSEFNVRRTTVDTETNGSSTINGGTFIDGEFIGFNSYRLEETIQGSFTVFAPWTEPSQGLSVSVDLEYTDDVLLAVRDPDLTDDVIGAITDPDFEFPQRDPIQPFNWEIGNVTITASDGSSMVISSSETEIGSFDLVLSNGAVIGPMPWTNEFFINP